ncbi:MAG TPA: hypothetical protein VHG91_09285 [Longimicrobium sp.]|nr:hypothetical protein [Longimicrobium sp.]
MVGPVFNFDVGAALSVLALLGAAGVVGCAAVSAAILLARGNTFATRWVAGTGAGYAGVLVLVSMAAAGDAGAPGAAKDFREAGGHVACPVEGGRRIGQEDRLSSPGTGLRLDPSSATVPGAAAGSAP